MLFGKKKYYENIDQMYEENEKLVYVFVRDHTDDEQLAMELAQIVWYKIWHSFEKIRQIEKKDLHNYIRAIVKNAAADHFNNEKRSSDMVNEITYLHDERSASVEEEIEEFLNRELGEYLDEAMAILTDDEKLLIKLKYGDQLKSAEIGSLLGISDASARMKLQRIREKLKKEIENLQRRDEHEGR